MVQNRHEIGIDCLPDKKAADSFQTIIMIFTFFPFLFVCLFVCLFFCCCFLHSVYSFNITQIQSGVLYTVVVSTVAEGQSGAVTVLASAPSVKTLIPSVFIVCIIIVSFPGLHP